MYNPERLEPSITREYLNSLLSAIPLDGNKNLDALRASLAGLDAFAFMDYPVELSMDSSGRYAIGNIKTESGFLFIGSELSISYTGNATNPPLISIRDDSTNKSFFAPLPGVSRGFVPVDLLGGNPTSGNLSAIQEPFDLNHHFFGELADITIEAKMDDADQSAGRVVHAVVSGWKIDKSYLGGF